MQNREPANRMIISRAFSSTVLAAATVVATALALSQPVSPAPSSDPSIGPSVLIADAKVTGYLDDPVGGNWIVGTCPADITTCE